MDESRGLSREGSETSRDLGHWRKKLLLILLCLFIVGNVVSLVVGVTSGGGNLSDFETQGIVKVLLGASTSNVTEYRE
jgi:hypothetical protein